MRNTKMTADTNTNAMENIKTANNVKQMCPAEVPSAQGSNYVYLLACADGSFYCGWTNDLAKRLAAHQSGKGGRYTRSHLPVRLVYYEPAASRETALKREAAIKKLNHKQKQQLIDTFRALL